MIEQDADPVPDRHFGRDAEDGPVTPARLREAQRRVATAEQNMRTRNALVRRAYAAGWSVEDIHDVLSDGGPISLRQVDRIRAGESSGRAHERRRSEQTEEDITGSE